MTKKGYLKLVWVQHTQDDNSDDGDDNDEC